MNELPTDIPAALVAALCGQRHPGYLRVDAEGRVAAWGGDLRRYGVPEPAVGVPVHECLAVAQGLLPTDEPAMVLPCIQVANGRIADVHFLSESTGCWVVLLDAAVEAARRQQVHQLNNELALLRRQAEQASANEADHTILAELLAALDVLVIDYREEASAIIGQVPSSFVTFFRTAQAAPAAIWERFPFLTNFLIDAKMHWSTGAPDFAKSGIWFEDDGTGNECALEATALTVGQRRVLFVELLSAAYQERRRLIQKAREGQLHSDALRKSGERLAVQAVELNRSNSELQQFASAASHDLRAPLRAIHSLTSWLEEDLDRSMTAEVREILRLLKDRVCRMDHMINGLLEYARADFKEHEISEVNVVEVVRELWYMLDPPAGFVLDVPTAAHVVHIARAPLAQVLRNLLSNAIQHHDGTAGRIAVRVREQDDSYEISVADDGPGIDAQYHERLFQMFQTLQPQAPTSGSGMGLALVKKIVNQHGGEATIAANEGRGSIFRVTWAKS